MVSKDERRINKIKTKVITKKQTPETDEALVLLERTKKRVKKIFIIPFFVFLIFSPVFYPIEEYGWAVAFAIMAFLCLIAYFIYRGRILSPYYSLLKIAMKNDEIRHEERIRFRERKRLETEQDSKIIVSKKEKTKIDKNKQQDIIKTKELDEDGKLSNVKESTLNLQPKRIIIPRPIPPNLKENGEK